jgi:hypothetical protein
MNTGPEKRLNRDDAERLLEGGTAGPPSLAQMLAAAAAPTGDEMAGETRTLAAFRQARSAPTTPQGRFAAMKAALVAALSTKLAAGAAVVAVAIGGLALAASAGVLPGTHGGSHPAPTSSVAPSPNLKGLCTAYEAGATANNGMAALDPAFTALATAAGGIDRIDAYCTKLLAAGHHGNTDHPTGAPASSHPTGRPSDLPTSSHPTGKPSELPSSHPTSKPSDRPSSHPTGKPTDVPSSHSTGRP